MTDVTGIFDELDPSQFHFAGTAVLDEEYPAGFQGVLEFIALNKLLLRSQFAAAEGNPNAVVTLASETRLRGFVATDDEDLIEFAERLAVEARSMGARQLFFYRRTRVAALPRSMPLYQEVKDAAIDVAGVNRDELLHDGVIWYSEYRDDENQIQLSGLFELAGPERLIDTHMLSQQPMALLAKILG